LARTSPELDHRPTVTVREGVAIPDWSVVTTQSARDAVWALFDTLIAKWGGLDEAEDRVLRAVHRAYAADGRGLAQDAGVAGLAPEDIASALRRLAARDLVTVDGAGRVCGAYPFTDGASDHQAQIGGVPVRAMCAIDALGIGAMLTGDSVVRSACRHCRGAIVVETRNEGRDLAHAEPRGVVVWSGHHYAGGCAASSLCTLQVFFCDEGHLDAWLGNRPIEDRAGTRLSLTEALEVGRAIFSPMMSDSP
jgi:hypothetical protein